jgi:NAD(P)H-dependent flavin oxidoreductase YrpB (nitropropane dioxygenase family)
MRVFCARPAGSPQKSRPAESSFFSSTTKDTKSTKGDFFAQRRKDRKETKSEIRISKSETNVRPNKSQIGKIQNRTPEKARLRFSEVWSFEFASNFGFRASNLTPEPWRLGARRRTTMIHTRICDLLAINHPIVLGGMGTATSASLVAAVSNAGGFGTLGTSGMNGAQITSEAEAIRERTDKPFGINHLLFRMQEENFAATLRARPNVVAFAWARADQDLGVCFKRVHDAGLKVMHMAGGVSEASRAAEAGADFIVAQGTEAGGHVGWMASLPLVPMVVNAVAPLPVLVAGGIADGRGLAAALALGAEGVLLGTRFLACVESPIHSNLKQVIVRSDGHDTVLTEIPDIATGDIWPGAMARAQRNAFIERWAGREWALRQCYREVGKAAIDARRAGDADNAPLLFGQDAGLIDSIKPAREIIEGIVAEAEEIIQTRLPGLLREPPK